MGASRMAAEFSASLRLFSLARFFTGVVGGTGVSPDAGLEASAPEAASGSEECVDMAKVLWPDLRGVNANL